MSKGKGSSGMRRSMPGGGQSGMLKQIQKMQQDMVEAQEKLAEETVEVSVGGGALTIVISGHQRVQSIAINKEAIDFEDEEWLADLQDLLVAGVNQAIEQSQTMAAQRMENITGGLGNMGLGDLLGGM
jgi:DNA-binding YbaB/EbfC family protein